MREFLTSLFLASCLLPIAAGGIQLSSDFAEPTAPHKFADLNSEPLWPSEVKRVDPSLQAYERLPASVTEHTMVAEAKPAERVKLVLGENKPEVARGQVSHLAELQSAKAQGWCGARYRSYDPADNTYQPYGGGPRRTCAAPIETPTSPIQEVAALPCSAAVVPNTHWVRTLG